MALVTTDAAALVEGTARFASAARRPTQTPRPGASRDRSASSASGTRSRQCWRSCDGISSISCRAHTARPADRVVWRAGGAPDPQFRMTEAITPYAAEFLTSTPPDS